MPPIRLAALASLMLLAACNGSGEKGPERKTAAGEVLGGSISDSMLPLDTVQSQSPPLRESAAGSADEATDSADKSAKGADTEKPVPDASPSAASSAAASASATPQAEN
jgi:hypothetical protein